MYDDPDAWKGEGESEDTSKEEHAYILRQVVCDLLSALVNNTGKLPHSATLKDAKRISKDIVEWSKKEAGL